MNLHINNTSAFYTAQFHVSKWVIDLIWTWDWIRPPQSQTNNQQTLTAVQLLTEACLVCKAHSISFFFLPSAIRLLKATLGRGGVWGASWMMSHTYALGTLHPAIQQFSFLKTSVPLAIVTFFQLQKHFVLYALFFLNWFADERLCNWKTEFPRGSIKYLSIYLFSVYRLLSLSQTHTCNHAAAASCTETSCKNLPARACAHTWYKYRPVFPHWPLWLGRRSPSEPWHRSGPPAGCRSFYPPCLDRWWPLFSCRRPANSRASERASERERGEMMRGDINNMATDRKGWRRERDNLGFCPAQPRRWVDGELWLLSLLACGCVVQ